MFGAHIRNTGSNPTCNICRSHLAVTIKNPQN